MVALVGTMLAPVDGLQDEAPAASVAATPVLTITGRDVSGVGPIAPGMVGANQRWVDDGDGAWDPETRKPQASITSLAEQIGLNAVRYPGGTVANMFDVGQMLAHGCQTNGGGIGGGVRGAMYQPITADRSGYTITQHAKVIDEIAGQSTLMVPMVNSSPKEAATFVNRLIDARPSQADIYVELANEPYGPNQAYWRSREPRVTLRQYIQGGVQHQPSTGGANRLFDADNCNLEGPAEGDGSTRRFRTRFGPIALDLKPTVFVNGKPHTFVRGAPGPREFTVEQQNVVVLGRAPADEAKLRISYSVRHGGFVQFRNAIERLDDEHDGVRIHVCSSWATQGFVDAMGSRPFECLAVHSYAEFEDGSESPTAADGFRRLMRQTSRESDELHALRTRIVKGHPNRFLMVTEFGSLGVAYQRQKDRFMHTVVLARMLASQGNEGVRISNLSNFSTLFWQRASGPVLSDQGYLLELVRHLVGQQPVTTAERHAGVTTLATTAGDEVQLFVVNQRTTAFSPTVQIPARTGATCVKTRSLQGQIDQLNDDGTGPPTTHRPAAAAATWPAGQLSGNVELPPVSITLLTFAPVGAGCTDPTDW
ncbi:hypothetical protein DJ010_10820 [Nocardioides silvaticus]|uniref:Alpha-L-arabinofuranosidase C-terminal domain-containing protein n=1 Tax=Nocardioides silvaticus TaxID=2201891 RepID=A0A316TKQ6_9ACTN|nr:hypothetical protein DJ010_10820 [Nocardioides silvaticus]